MKQILKSHAYKQWEPQLNQPSMIGSLTHEVRQKTRAMKQILKQDRGLIELG